MTKTTPEQIDNLIAEKIGWQAKPCDGEVHEMAGGWICSQCGLDGDWTSSNFDRFSGHMQQVPSYSTDMNAAMEALKHACLGYSYHLVSRGKLVQELFMLPQGLDILNAHYAMGMMCAWTPENICIAILKAYGVEIEQ